MDELKPDDLEDPENASPYSVDEPGEPESPQRQRLNADSLLDKVIPEEIDWRHLVRRHPMVSIGVAAGLGFLLGRSKGAAIVAGLSAGVTTAVMRQLSDVFEGEVFEF